MSTAKRILEIPELALVAMIGASGSGKSTFARRHFAATEILSSDFFRGLVSDDENDQAATRDAFDALFYLLDKRLARDRLTVIDATNVRMEDRRKLIEHARRYYCQAAAIVINPPESVCIERNQQRPDRADMRAGAVHRQAAELKRGLRGLEREGFRYVHILNGTEEVEIRRTTLWNNKKAEGGPFDLVGDLHGCADELRALLAKLGWERRDLDADAAPWGHECYRHPAGRRAIFLGDLVDRGPAVLDTIRIVRNMVTAGTAFCVPGNHDQKLARWLNGRDVQVKHGLQQSINELTPLDEASRRAVRDFLDGLISHYVFDDGRLVAAHAGLREEMHGRAAGPVREFCLYGETTGETDEFGLPVRYNWAAEYRGRAMVVYGHTPVPAPEFLNNTVNIDTGAVFGGRLTALRYPEREFVDVAAPREYATPARPIVAKAAEPTARTAQQELDDVLDLADVIGKRILETRLMERLTVREENAIAALEVMSRFATDPHWLVYLPPTMSPGETSKREGMLEHPDEVFAYFRAQGVERVVCEEKHMGSRAIVVVARDEAAARRRFGIAPGATTPGACYTRTGRPFFPDAADEAAFIARVQAALTKAGFWDEFQSSWFCLDCEMMPWSAKAQALLERQYAAVGAAGAAGETALGATVAALRAAPAAAELLPAFERRLKRLERYREAYRRYCWPVHSLADYRLAPFHLLASEGAVHTDKTNRWHMETLHRLAATDPEFLIATPFREVELADEAQVAAGAAW